ncbi:hypothetical protein BJF78_28635 [Pseudonocardia sp. CNS-139]|nr:hypothetical protein BJF78_28635 [Pseudonocardia sp. CNS-139]
MYAAVAQVVRRLRLLVAVQVLTVLATVGGTLALVPAVGLVGVGLASLGAQAGALVLVAVPLARELARMRAQR